jgi:hypothetical protein
MRMVWLAISFGALAACAAPAVSPEVAADRCEQRARGAQAPTGGITFGVNSNNGAFTEARIGVTSDFLAGTDPVALYDRCVLEMTGEAAIRRPVLR